MELMIENIYQSTGWRDSFSSDPISCVSAICFHKSIFHKELKIGLVGRKVFQFMYSLYTGTLKIDEL